MTWLAVRAFLGRVPKQVWLALAVVALIVSGVIWHGHRVHSAINAAEKRGADAEAKRIEVKALALKAKIDALTKSIADIERKANSEKISSSNARADALLVRGAGKASCPRNAFAASPASGPQPPARSGNDPLAGLPDAGGTELIALPFPGAVGAGKVCDANLIDNQSWRSWYAKLVEAWPK